MSKKVSFSCSAPETWRGSQVSAALLVHDVAKLGLKFSQAARSFPITDTAAAGKVCLHHPSLHLLIMSDIMLKYLLIQAKEYCSINVLLT